MLITYFQGMHAPLYKRYDPYLSDFVTVGQKMGEYAREDDSGAEYRCLGTQEKNKVYCSSDYKPGFFYPSTIFVSGEKLGESSSHPELKEFVKKTGWYSVRRVILPNGIDRGIPTWIYALMYSPPELTPQWGGIPGIVRRQFPNCLIICEYPYRIEIEI